jgi:hypothetical protein
MILKDFVTNFIRPNSLVKLWVPIKGGHKQLIEGSEALDGTFMEWAILRKSCPFNTYLNNEVLGVTDILTKGPYPEAINIVIKLT